jgi:hypothetical protein
MMDMKPLRITTALALAVLLLLQCQTSLAQEGNDEWSQGYGIGVHYIKDSKQFADCWLEFEYGTSDCIVDDSVPGDLPAISLATTGDPQDALPDGLSAEQRTAFFEQATRVVARDLTMYFYHPEATRVQVYVSGILLAEEYKWSGENYDRTEEVGEPHCSFNVSVMPTLDIGTFELTIEGFDGDIPNIERITLGPAVIDTELNEAIVIMADGSAPGDGSAVRALILVRGVNDQVPQDRQIESALDGNTVPWLDHAEFFGLELHYYIAGANRVNFKYREAEGVVAQEGRERVDAIRGGLLLAVPYAEN